MSEMSNKELLEKIKKDLLVNKIENKGVEKVELTYEQLIQKRKDNEKKIENLEKSLKTLEEKVKKFENKTNLTVKDFENEFKKKREKIENNRKKLNKDRKDRLDSVLKIIK